MTHSIFQGFDWLKTLEILVQLPDRLASLAYLKEVRRECSQQIDIDHNYTKQDFLNKCNNEIEKIEDSLKYAPDNNIQSKKKGQRNKGSKEYSHKQIAIAYWAMGILITKDNAAKILEKYSNNRSVAKLLRAQVIKPSKLTTLYKTQITNTKHLHCLIEAKRLISSTRIGQNKDEALNKIERIITAFKTSYDNG